MVANGQLETPKSSIELKFEVGGIEFLENFIHSNGERDRTHNWTIVPSEKSYSFGHETGSFELPIFPDATQIS